MTSLETKRHPHFSVILQVSPSFLKKKGLKKEYHNLRKTHTNRVVFLSRNQSRSINDAPPVLIAGYTTQFQGLVASWLGG